MPIPRNHWDENGKCSCPLDGICCSCGKPCNDHDLAADTYVCQECFDKSWDKFEKECKENVED